MPPELTDIALELTAREADALTKALNEVRRRGLGAVDFDPSLLTAVRKKLLSAQHRTGELT